MNYFNPARNAFTSNLTYLCTTYPMTLPTGASSLISSEQEGPQHGAQRQNLLSRTARITS